jgi:PAT family beta-lactamase induction signal transducer AmpG
MTAALSNSSVRRFVNFGAIYAAQGLPMGFAVFAVPAWLAGAGARTVDIGVVAATAMLPWAFKVVWAPLVDRFKYRPMGRFRGWIVGAQAGLLASTLGLLFVRAPLAHLQALSGALFAQALFASMSDVAGDGLAIEVCPARERGMMNAVMFGGQAAGNAVGGAGLALVLTAFGFRAAVGVELALLLVLCAQSLVQRERPGERLFPWSRGAPVLGHTEPAAVAMAGGAGRLWRALRTRTSVRALVVWVVAYFLSGSLGILMTAAAVRDHGFDKAEYSSVLALALVPFLLGALLGGWIADRRGRTGVITVALAIGATFAAGFGLAAPLWSAKAVWVVYILGAAAGNGMLVAVLTALFMDLAVSGIAATQFAICMALGNLGAVLGRASAGALEAHFSLSSVSLAAAVALAALGWWTCTGVPPAPGRV